MVYLICEKCNYSCDVPFETGKCPYCGQGNMTEIEYCTFCGKHFHHNKMFDDSMCLDCRIKEGKGIEELRKNIFR